MDGVVESFDPKFGLLNMTIPGGRLIAPAPPAVIGERRRLRILATDVSLARESLAQLDPQRPARQNRDDEGAGSL